MLWPCGVNLKSVSAVNPWEEDQCSPSSSLFSVFLSGKTRLMNDILHRWSFLSLQIRLSHTQMFSLTQYLCSHILSENKGISDEALRVRSLICRHRSHKHGWFRINLCSYRARCITFLRPALGQQEGFYCFFYVGQGCQFMRSCSSVWLWDSMSSVPASLKEPRFSRQQTHTRSHTHQTHLRLCPRSGPVSINSSLPRPLSVLM